MGFKGRLGDFLGFVLLFHGIRPRVNFVLHLKGLCAGLGQALHGPAARANIVALAGDFHPHKPILGAAPVHLTQHSAPIR
jgi:hypothetical protein